MVTAVKRVVVRVIFMVVEVQEEPLTDLFAFCDVFAGRRFHLNFRRLARVCCALETDRSITRKEHSLWGYLRAISSKFLKNATESNAKK